MSSPMSAPVGRAPNLIGLGTSTVHPETTAAAFETAKRLGYDGVELMVGVDSASTDIDFVASLQDYHQVRVMSIHSPCLVITPHVWGRDPWEKLRTSCRTATRLGADVVVVHPPFTWQREYARDFINGVRRMIDETGVVVAVENMYPWRAWHSTVQGYLPHWNPTGYDYDHLVLDLSHASTAQLKAIDLADAWGERLRHVHLTDGKGSFKDDHLFPGEGDQDAWGLVESLAERGFAGHIIHEISTRACATHTEREQRLADCLAVTREHLAIGAARREGM
ncbi:sugar phosphate isomerase/epimerase family protein [Propionibacterium sp. oral taxon 192]|uniref:sugar phosphate isomerase/epimerase family protein n=1 Tax=Propionibacterium sp. oral taxon 192 TaxID=671222 RepID=UPI001E4E125D|nr:sugar phosphate isomerase/epimerase [Propionibacterium sp. oral taxon 192]